MRSWAIKIHKSSRYNPSSFSTPQVERGKVTSFCYSNHFCQTHFWRTKTHIITTVKKLSPGGIAKGNLLEQSSYLWCLITTNGCCKIKQGSQSEICILMPAAWRQEAGVPRYRDANANQELCTELGLQAHTLFFPSAPSVKEIRT